MKPYIAICTAVPFLVYLLGSFVAMDFNIINWNIPGRFLYVMLSIAVSAFGSSVWHYLTN